MSTPTFWFCQATPPADDELLLEEDGGVEELEEEEDICEELELEEGGVEELEGVLDATELAALEVGVELATDEELEEGGAELDELEELAGALIVCVSDALVHVLKFEFPLYTAVSTCAPTVSVAIST